jgi:hypothetical protein
MTSAKGAGYTSAGRRPGGAKSVFDPLQQAGWSTIYLIQCNMT